MTPIEGTHEIHSMDTFVPMDSLWVAAIAPWVLIPAAVGAAIAGISGRRRLAAVLIVVAAAAVIAPIAWSMAEFSGLD